MAHNMGSPIVGWMEPEKEGYVSQIEKTVVPILNNEADLVVPKRKSLKSYPISQQYAEHFGNTIWKELTGVALDMWSGPRTWKRELSSYFLDYKGEYGDLWDSIFIPVMNVIYDGKGVLSVDINYTHPKEQTELEEGDSEFSIKRLNQLNNLIPALKTHWAKLNSEEDM